MKEYRVYARIKKDSKLQHVADNFDTAVMLMDNCHHIANYWKNCNEIYILEYDPDSNEIGSIIEQEVL